MISEELAQDVFLEAIKEQDNYDPTRGSIKKWLSLLIFRVDYAYSHNIGHSRDAMNKISFSLDDPLEDDEGDSMTGHDIYDEELWEDYSKFYVENKQDVDYYLEQLTSRLAVVVQLRLIRGHSWEEVGNTMNCSGENARTMCRRAVQELKLLIEG